MAILLIRHMACAVAISALLGAGGQPPPAGLAFGGRTLLHAHNCYPEEGQWQDRLDRALATGASPVAIEQDLTWAPAAGGRPGQPVVSHDTDLSGSEPSLEQHFFARLRPVMERALADNQRDRWPLVILHLDFKSNEPELHQAVWHLLSRHRAWLTTTERVADGSRVMPLTPGPLLVLTENGDGQEAAFSTGVPAGERLLIFGTTPGHGLALPDDPGARAELLATVPAASLVPWPATNYRRWTNFAWNVVERGGQAGAGPWTAEDTARLAAIVGRAHELGLWVRFYTLNGHDATANKGWTNSYNFGSTAAVRPRWQAAIAAGVDFLATDQYEEFAALLPGRR